MVVSTHYSIDEVRASYIRYARFKPFHHSIDPWCLVSRTFIKIGWYRYVNGQTTGLSVACAMCFLNGVYDAQDCTGNFCPKLTLPVPESLNRFPAQHPSRDEKGSAQQVLGHCMIFACLDVGRGTCIWCKPQFDHQKHRAFGGRMSCRLSHGGCVFWSSLGAIWRCYNQVAT